MHVAKVREAGFFVYVTVVCDSASAADAALRDRGASPATEARTLAAVAAELHKQSRASLGFYTAHRPPHDDHPGEAEVQFIYFYTSYPHGP
jgi:hypothetical protein